MQAHHSTAQFEDSGNQEQKQSENEKLCFIEGDFDDYGLNELEYRVYCRILRRAGKNSTCFQSIAGMAKEFHKRKLAIQLTVKVLEKMHLIQRHKRPGQTDQYSPLQPSQWLPKEGLESVRRRVWQGPRKLKLVTTDPGPDEQARFVEGPGSGSLRDLGDVRSGTHEVSPSEVSPLEVPPAEVPPPSITSAETTLDTDTGHKTQALVLAKSSEHPRRSLTIQQKKGFKKPKTYNEALRCAKGDRSKADCIYTDWLLEAGLAVWHIYYGLAFYSGKVQDKSADAAERYLDGTIRYVHSNKFEDPVDLPDHELAQFIIWKAHEDSIEYDRPWFEAEEVWA